MSASQARSRSPVLDRQVRRARVEAVGVVTRGLAAALGVCGVARGCGEPAVVSVQGSTSSHGKLTVVDGQLGHRELRGVGHAVHPSGRVQDLDVL